MSGRGVWCCELVVSQRFDLLASRTFHKLVSLIWVGYADIPRTC